MEQERRQPWRTIPPVAQVRDKAAFGVHRRAANEPTRWDAVHDCCKGLDSMCNLYTYKLTRWDPGHRPHPSAVRNTRSILARAALAEADKHRDGW